MKFNTFKISLLLITLFATASVINSRSLSPGNKELAKNYLVFAKLTYCPAEDLKSSTCETCQEIIASGFKINSVHSATEWDINFTMAVSVNTNTKEVVVSFAGPKSESIAFIQSIYSPGFSKVKLLGGAQIEKTFWDVYSKFFRSGLIEELKKIGQDYKFIFTGHSFGGSIATLAAYDMVYNLIIHKSFDKGPFIYSFAALKIGVSGFLKVIQDFIGTPIMRIRKKYDFFTLVPRCVYDEKTSVFNCYGKYVDLVKDNPVYSKYFYNFSPKAQLTLEKQVPALLQNQGINYKKQGSTKSGGSAPDTASAEQPTDQFPASYPFPVATKHFQPSTKDHNASLVASKSSIAPGKNANVAFRTGESAPAKKSHAKRSTNAASKKNNVGASKKAAGKLNTPSKKAAGKLNTPSKKAAGKLNIPSKKAAGKLTTPSKKAAGKNNVASPSKKSDKAQVKEEKKQVKKVEKIQKKIEKETKTLAKHANEPTKVAKIQKKIEKEMNKLAKATTTAAPALSTAPTKSAQKQNKVAAMPAKIAQKQNNISVAPAKTAQKQNNAAQKKPNLPVAPQKANAASTAKTNRPASPIAGAAVTPAAPTKATQPAVAQKTGTQFKSVLTTSAASKKQKDLRNKKSYRFRRFLFLEIKSSLSTNVWRNKKLSDLFKTCVAHDNYVACQFNPIAHRTFWSVDMESC